MKILQILIQVLLEVYAFQADLMQTLLDVASKIQTGFPSLLHFILLLIHPLCAYIQEQSKGRRHV